jgi:hypothetical protein
MALLNEANKIYVGSALSAKVYLGSTQVWPSTPAVNPLRQTMVVGGLSPVWVSTDGTRDAMVHGVMINRKDA